MEQNRKRIIGGALFLGALTLLLCARLFYIQILCHAELAAAARAQYETALVGIDDRGQIFDRDLRPLTGGKYRYYYIISKETCKPRQRAGSSIRCLLRSARKGSPCGPRVMRSIGQKFSMRRFIGSCRSSSAHMRFAAARAIKAAKAPVI